jgi:hypothetical protein
MSGMGPEYSIPKVLAAGQLVTGPGAFREASMRETAGAVAIVQIFDGTSGAGTLIGTYGFLAKQSIVDTASNPRRFTTGLFVVITGTVEGNVCV